MVVLLIHVQAATDRRYRVQHPPAQFLEVSAVRFGEPSQWTLWIVLVVHVTHSEGFPYFPVSAQYRIVSASWSA